MKKKQLYIKKVPELYTSSINYTLYYSHDQFAYITQENLRYMLPQRLHNPLLKERGPPFDIPKLCQPFDQISFGAKHCVYTINGKCYSFGDDNSLGQLGPSHEYHQLIEIPFTDENDVIEQISCGHNFSFIRTSSGKCYAWGCNSYGQLGLSNDECTHDVFDTFCTNPTLVPFKQKIKHVECSFFYTTIITDNGLVYIFGQFNFTDFVSNPYLVIIPNLESVVSISCGFSHLAMITKNGHCYVMGSNSHGQLGIGNEKERRIVDPRKIICNARIVNVSCGMYHTGK